MTAAEKHYHEIENKMKEVKKNKMFGALCMKLQMEKHSRCSWKTL